MPDEYECNRARRRMEAEVERRRRERGEVRDLENTQRELEGKVREAESNLREAEQHLREKHGDLGTIVNEWREVKRKLNGFLGPDNDLELEQLKNQFEQLEKRKHEAEGVQREADGRVKDRESQLRTARSEVRGNKELLAAAKSRESQSEENIQKIQSDIDKYCN